MKRLLVVDDEPYITRLIETAARSIGFEVMSINDTDQFEKAIGTIRPTIPETPIPSRGDVLHLQDFH